MANNKMKGFFRKAISLLVVLAMVMPMMFTTAFAAGGEEVHPVYRYFQLAINVTQHPGENPKQRIPENEIPNFVTPVRFKCREQL